VVRKFGSLGGQEIWEGGRFFRILSSVRNVLWVDCVSYAGDYSTVRLVHKHYCFSSFCRNTYSYKYILICCSSCQNPRQNPFWDTNTATILSSDRDDDNLEDREVGKFGRLGRSRGFSGLGGREFWEVSEVGKFLEVKDVGKSVRLERSEKFGGREVWEDCEDTRIERILSPVKNLFLQVRVDCVSYHSGDNRTQRLVHSIIVLLHVVQIPINLLFM
jgi:hypothetical protein